MFRRILLAATFCVATLGASQAQDFSRNPSFGTHNLQAGFAPDPYMMDVRAGGTIEASRLGNNCTGTIANAPDVRVNYTAGNFPLYIFGRSRADTTLVVNLPNGNWICNDDFEELNPGIVLNRPESGQYDIWLGVFEGGSGIPAQIGVSEIPPRR